MITRARKCVDSRRSYVLAARPDMSVVPEETGQPTMAVLIQSSVVPGKQMEYERWVKNEILPALKKAGSHVLAHQTVFGGDVNRWVFVSMVDNYAAFDKGPPLVRALGREGSQKVLANSAGLRASSEYYVIRYDPELSFGRPE